MNQFIEGFLLQASLILALGAQNLFVLESGLKKQRHLLVALICSICDAALIALGVLGAASVFVQVPWLRIVFGILGVAFLVYYGFKKLSEAMSAEPVAQEKPKTTSSFRQVLYLSLSFSLLNPHVYLDTVVLVGGYSAKFLHLSERALFGLGAAIFSFLWFFGLSAFAFSLSEIFKSGKLMKATAFVSGLILLGV